MSRLFANGYSYEEFMQCRHSIDYSELKKWYHDEFDRELVIDISNIDVKEKIFLVLSEPELYKYKFPDMLYGNFSLIADEITVSNYRTAMNLINDEFLHADIDHRNLIQNGIIIILNTLLSNSEKFNIVVSCLPKFLSLMTHKKIKYMFDSNKEFTRAFLYMICASDDNYMTYIDIMDNDKLSDDTAQLSNQMIQIRYNLAMTSDRHIIMLLFLSRQVYILNKLGKMGKLSGNYSYGSLTPQHIARYYKDDKLKNIAAQYSDNEFFFSKFWLSQFVPLYLIRLGLISVELLGTKADTSADTSTRDIVIKYPRGDKIISEFNHVDRFNTNCNIYYKKGEQLQHKFEEHIINMLETTKIWVKCK